MPPDVLRPHRRRKNSLLGLAGVASCRPLSWSNFYAYSCSDSSFRTSAFSASRSVASSPTSTSYELALLGTVLLAIRLGLVGGGEMIIIVDNF